MEFKKGEILAINRCCRVEGIDPDEDILYVVDLHTNIKFKIKGSDIQNQYISADRHDEILRVSKTEMVRAFMNSKGMPVTVVFKKADGDMRLIRCRVLEPEDHFGRSLVEDLDKPEGDRTRLVDHRTMESLILEGTKYTLK